MTSKVFLLRGLLGKVIFPWI